MNFRKVCKIVAIAGGANFILFWIVGQILGGEALQGKVEDGRYYLTNQGKHTEVSHFVFTYSYIHAISVNVSWPFVLVAFGYLSITQWKEKRKATQPP